MTIYTQTPNPGPGRLSEHLAPLSDVLGADVESSWLAAPVSSILRSGELTVAERGAPNAMGAAIGSLLGAPYLAAGSPGLPAIFRNEPDSPLIDAETARGRVESAGVQGIQVPDAGIRSRALDILIDRKKKEINRQSKQARSPGGIGVNTLRFGASLGTQMVDPINAASAFIPIYGPARYATALGKAGSAIGRAGVRARFGAVEGAVGAAAVEPIIFGAATQEQADYGFADSLLNIGLGTVLGGGLHIGAGAASDAYRAGKNWRTQRAPIDAPLPRAIDGMTHTQREALLRTSVAQALSGREINPLITYEGGGARFGEEFRAGGTDVFEPTAKVDEATGVEGITVYHGSPHTFDRFSTSKIGTGEGNQAYGHGLYFAESRGVAGSYRDALTKDPREDVNRLLHDIASTKQITAAGTIRERIAKHYPEWSDDMLRDAVTYVEGQEPGGTISLSAMAAIKRLDKALGPPPKGSLYEVRLNADPEDFLDWDKPLSEQSEKVKAALAPLIEERFRGGSARYRAEMLGDNPDGAKVYRELDTGGGVISQKLRDAGLPGIRYLDQGSRTTGEGSRNYVVFDDSLITTVRRNEENLLRRPEDLRAAATASFAPEASRLYDIEAVRSAEEKIAAAPADDEFPEQALEAAMEDITALVAALEATARGKKAKPLKPGKIADPERRMPRFPVQDMLKASGGVNPDSPLGAELMAMGLTKTNTRGLFKRTGRGAADNFVASEHGIFAGKTEEGFDYVPEHVVLEALRSEIFGDPWRSPAQMEDIERHRQIVGMREGVVREEGPMPGEGAPPVQSEEEYGSFEELISRELAEMEELQMTAEAYGRAAQEAASCSLRRGI